MLFLWFFCIAYLCTEGSRALYVPPEALVEPLKPVGIRISIPHETGISLVAFHVKFNDDFIGLEAGTIARDIVKAKNNRWTYQDKTTVLKPGDVIYYWIHVVYNGLGYNLVDQQHVVTDFSEYNSNGIVEHDRNKGNRVPTKNKDKLNSSSNNSNYSVPPPCLPSVTKVYGSNEGTRNPCIGELLFEDKFKDLDDIERKNWTVLEQFSKGPDYEFVVYRDSRANLNAQNGLKITPKLLKDEYGESFVREGNLTLHDCTGIQDTVDCSRIARGWNVLPPVSSSRINTKKFLKFAYGRVVVKAKFPSGDWIYPIILLESEEDSQGSHQLRIASAAGNTELRTTDHKDISGHVLWGGVVNAYSNADRITNKTATKYSKEMWSENYHKYEAIWAPERIILKVDDQVYENREIYLPVNTPFYLTLGVAVGGLTEFPDHSISLDYSKSWRNVEAKAVYQFFKSTSDWYNTWQSDATSLKVDYVKVYAL